MRRWYEELFTNYAKTYDTESFTTGTLGEVDFLEKELDTDERFYTPSEIAWYLSTLGFKKSSIHGSHLGNFSREHALTTDDFEMLVIAEK